jgi:hypothetical protein
MIDGALGGSFSSCALKAGSNARLVFCRGVAAGVDDRFKIVPFRKKVQCYTVQA